MGFHSRNSSLVLQVPWCKSKVLSYKPCRDTAFLPIWRKKTGKSGHVTVLDFLVRAQGCKISDTRIFLARFNVNKHAKRRKR